MRVDLHTWNGKVGTIRLTDAGIAEPDPGARRWLDDFEMIEPDTLAVLTYADGERYLRALPVNINGSAMRAVMVDG